MNIIDIYKGVEWVWFDLDDTLYDFQASSLMALKRVFGEFRLDSFFNGEQQWIDIYHRHNAALWVDYAAGTITQATLRRERFVRPMAEVGADMSVVEPILASLDETYLRHLAETGLLVDGAMELVDNLRSAGFRIGIVSNGFIITQYGKLESSGLSGKIDCVVLSDEIGINKPDRRLFDYALTKSSATASGSLMIGDNPDTDIRGALGAGWHAMLFSPHGHQADGVPTLTSLRDLNCLTRPATSRQARSLFAGSKMVKD